MTDREHKRCSSCTCGRRTLGSHGGALSGNQVARHWEIFNTETTTETAVSETTQDQDEEARPAASLFVHSLLSIVGKRQIKINVLTISFTFDFHEHGYPPDRRG